MTGSGTDVVRVYGVVPVKERADTVHSMEATLALVDSPEVSDTLSAVAAWKSGVAYREVATQA